MAITIKTDKIGKSNYGGYSNSFSIRPQINIKIQADGTINTSNLDLGNQGDDGVTLIKFDISGLVNKPDFFKSNDRYQPLIIHRFNGKSTSFDFDGENFFVSSDVTKNAGVHEFVYVVKEINSTPVDEYRENLPTKNEVFTSSIFSGTVKQTNYLQVMREDTELKTDLAVEVDNFFRKPSKEISYQGKITGSNLLGYTLDKHTTFLQLTETHPDLNYYMVYFTGYVDNEGEPVIQTIGVGFDDNLKCWVPEEVTKIAGDKQLMVVGYDETGSEYFSDVFVMIVKDNKITEEDFTPDINHGDALQVSGDNGELMRLADENGNPILIKETQPATHSYLLNYTGEEVEDVLDYTAKGEESNNLWLNKEINNIKQNISNKADKPFVEESVLKIF